MDSYDQTKGTEAKVVSRAFNGAVPALVPLGQEAPRRREAAKVAGQVAHRAEVDAGLVQVWCDVAIRQWPLCSKHLTLSLKRTWSGSTGRSRALWGPMGKGRRGISNCCGPPPLMQAR